jgi:hypothetical protein
MSSRDEIVRATQNATVPGDVKNPPQKSRWSAPQITILDAKQTLTGAPSTLEETPTDKLGS